MGAHHTASSVRLYWEIITVHAPHPPSPHPSLLPVRDTTRERKVTDTACHMCIFIVPTFGPEVA